MGRKRCSVCKLYVGSKPHSGLLHDRIRAQRAKMKRGLWPFRRRKG